MKAADELRARFSPYEMAAAISLAGYLIFVLFLVLLFNDAAPIATLGAGAAAIMFHVAAWCLGRCPACGKSALKYYLLNRERGIGRLFFARRLWPERECSSCRTALDVV